MSNIKDTLEANAFAGKLINAGVSIAPDGIETSEIIGQLGLLMEAPEAAKGIGNYVREQAGATIEDQEERKAAFGDKLTALKPRSQYNISNFAHGVQCLIAEIVEKTANEIAEGIEKNGLPATSMSDGGGVTGAMLLANAQ